MLECLLTARWPSRTPRLSLPPLHVRSAAWSATGLIAFTSTDPDSPEDTEDGFPIYIRAAGRCVQGSTRENSITMRSRDRVLIIAHSCVGRSVRSLCDKTAVKYDSLAFM